MCQELATHHLALRVVRHLQPCVELASSQVRLGGVELPQRAQQEKERGIGCRAVDRYRDVLRKKRAVSSVGSKERYQGSGSSRKPECDARCMPRR